MSIAGGTKVLDSLSLWHFPSSTGQLVNSQVISVEGSRVLVSCSPLVPGVTKLQVPNSTFGVVWVPADILRAEHLPLPVVQFALPDDVDIDKILGLCLATDNVSDLSSSDSLKPSRSTQQLMAMFSAFSTQITSTLAQQQQTMDGLSARMDAPSTSLITPDSLTLPTSMSASSMLPTSVQTMLRPAKSNVELGSRLQNAKSVFWGGSDEGGSEEADGSDGDDSSDLNAQFSLLSEKAPTKVKAPETAPFSLDQALSSAALTPEHLNALTQVEILKQLRKTSKSRRGGGSSSEGHSSSGGHGGLKGVSYLRRRYRKKPGKLVKRYLQQQREFCGVTDPRQVWHLRDVSKKLLPTFGVMKGLWRCHIGFQEIIWMLLEDKPLQATAFACQLSKALHQVALDQGDWSNALPMIPVADLLAAPQFGGDEVEMQMIHSYKKAMKELKTKHSVEERPPAAGGDHADASQNAKDRKKEAWQAKRSANNNKDKKAD